MLTMIEIIFGKVGRVRTTTTACHHHAGGGGGGNGGGAGRGGGGIGIEEKEFLRFFFVHCRFLFEDALFGRRFGRRHDHSRTTTTTATCREREKEID